MAPYTPGNYRCGNVNNTSILGERGHCGSSTYTSGIVMLLLNDTNIICNENRAGYLCMHTQNTYSIHKHEPPTKQKRTEHTDSKGCFFA